MTEFEVIEFRSEPERPLHDSGYRLLSLTGVNNTSANNLHTESRTRLHHNADHIVLDDRYNIDVLPDGTVRIAARYGADKGIEVDTGFMGSDAMLKTTERTT